MLTTNRLDANNNDDNMQKFRSALVVYAIECVLFVLMVLVCVCVHTRTRLVSYFVAGLQWILFLSCGRDEGLKTSEMAARCQ